MSTNIMGFDIPKSQDRTLQQAMWWVLMILCLCIVVGAGVIQKISYVNISLDVGVQSLVHMLIGKPQIQRSLLGLVGHIRTRTVPSETDVLDLYQQRYNSSCNSDIDEILCDVYLYREELVQYLGYDTPKTYLILLQNSAEVRPNGGFYGSFVRLTLSSGMIESMSVHDSYEVPFVNSGVSLALPERTTNYLGHNEATFIAGNKFGFTERDGRVISSIYNKVYDTSLDGVIFVSTDTMVKLVPQLQTQLWKRQFVNAAVDLIRGTTGAFKKDLYLTDMKSYISSNKINLVSQALQNKEQLTKPGMIQVYLPDTSTGLQDILSKNNRITQLQPEHLYLWDINQSHNKVSTFVHKSASIIHNGAVVSTTQDTSIDLSMLEAGEYTLQLEYNLDIPHRYVQYIQDLEQEYDIILTDRERHILALDPEAVYRSVIFAGSGIVLHSLTGDIDSAQVFDAPPTQAASYHIETTGQVRTLTLTFSKK